MIGFVVLLALQHQRQTEHRCQASSPHLAVHLHSDGFGIKRWIFATPLNASLKGLAAKIADLTAALFKLSLKSLFVFPLAYLVRRGNSFRLPNFLSYFNEFSGGVFGGTATSWIPITTGAGFETVKGFRR